MPTYEYACTECGHQFEVVQSFSEDAVTECPACQGAVRKIYGGVGIVFKGSGFYKNDSRGASTSSAPTETPSASSGVDSQTSSSSATSTTPSSGSSD